MRSKLLTSTWLAAILLTTSPGGATYEAELNALLLESSNLMRAGRIEEALILLEGAKEQYSDSREYMNNLAVAYLGNSQPDVALSILRQLVDSDPMYSIIAHNLLEMELQISESSPEQIKPVLFVQTVDSFFEEELAGRQQPTAEPPTSAAELPTAIADVDLRARARDLVERWANRWSAKDYSGYIDMYSRDFIGPDGEAYRQWAEDRRAPLDKSGNISVIVSNFEVESLDESRVAVRFDQRYFSKNYSDHVRKQLTLAAEDSGWKIVGETTLRTY